VWSSRNIIFSGEEKIEEKEGRKKRSIELTLDGGRRRVPVVAELAEIGWGRKYTMLGGKLVYFFQI
jgi:hypothetical protein